MTIGVVAVTGAASGIGLALACEAIERGYSVAAFDQNQPALASLQARLGPDRCRICPGDVTSDADLERFSDTVMAFGRPLRLAFANAGVLRAGEVLDQPIADIEQMLAINLVGAIRTARALVPLMRSQIDPSIFVFTGSSSMLLASPGYAGYAASKHGLLAMAEALDAELALANASVRTAVLCPAAVQTGIADGDTPLLARLQLRMQSHGISAQRLSQIAFDRLAAGERVIFSSDLTKDSARARFDALLGGGYGRQQTQPT